MAKNIEWSTLHGTCNTLHKSPNGPFSQSWSHMAARVAGWCVNDPTSIQLYSGVHNCAAAAQA